MDRNKKRMAIIFISFFIILNLTGCGKDLSGTYVSKSDNNRKVVIESSSVLKIIDGKRESRFNYSVAELMGVPIIGISPEFSFTYTDGFMKKENALVLIDTNEEFVKRGFLTDLWTEHKFLIIAGFVVLGLIGMLHEKYEEYQEQKKSS